ncbi:hypothetical protein T01_8914 [Trichinella spiralis]|uniref:Uncharacterized protein n=1 Tax=Trichinella spiralis TaxID=6334 RepID=A0A0V1APT5_TRISP|nr:hypothetical protein T01_8914 [Trichinella spiralis]
MVVTAGFGRQDCYEALADYLCRRFGKAECPDANYLKFQQRPDETVQFGKLLRDLARLAAIQDDTVI